MPGLMALGSLTKALAVPRRAAGLPDRPARGSGGLATLAAPWSLNAFAAAVARVLPEHLEAIRQDRRTNDGRRRALTARLAALGAKVAPSRANFLLCDFGRPADSIAAALEGEGILVRRCASFGLPDRFLRLAVRTEAENARLLRRWKGDVMKVVIFGARRRGARWPRRASRGGRRGRLRDGEYALRFCPPAPGVRPAMDAAEMGEMPDAKRRTW
jgi:histidinol-phosphate/aromatic aminotransferase/cobyric acid decarboxylase-like protein